MSTQKKYQIRIQTKDEEFIEILDEAGVEDATLCYSVNDVTDPEEIFDAVCERYTSETDISRNDIRILNSSLILSVFENYALDAAGFVYADTEFHVLHGINREFDFTAKSLASIIKYDADNIKKYDIIIDGVDISSIVLADHKQALSIEDWAKCSEDNAIAILEAHRNSIIA